MSPSARYAKKHAKARQRRRLQAQDRLARDRRKAQRAAEALHQALEDLGLPANLVVEIEGRLRSQQKLLGKIVGVRFPALFGCRTPSELCRVRGWALHWPSRILRALAHTVLAQAAAALGSGGVGADLASCGAHKPGHPESLAVDLGLGCLGVAPVWGATGSRRQVVEWPAQTCALGH